MLQFCKIASRRSCFQNPNSHNNYPHWFKSSEGGLKSINKSKTPSGIRISMLPFCKIAGRRPYHCLLLLTAHCPLQTAYCHYSPIPASLIFTLPSSPSVARRCNTIPFMLRRSLSASSGMSSSFSGLRNGRSILISVPGLKA
jgi:hypothetical protein